MRPCSITFAMLLILTVPFTSCGQETEKPAAPPPSDAKKDVPGTPVIWGPGRDTVAPAGDEQVVPLESGPGASVLTSEMRKRMGELPLQDLLDRNNGRYTMMKDDGVSGHWGLDAIKVRCEVGPKPNDRLRAEDGTCQTERLVFSDTGTGATMMMLTRLPYVAGGPGDQLNYFGKACWSADGSKMLWVRDAKAGLWGPGYQKTTDEFGPMLVKADGSEPRIAFKGRAFKGPICSPVRPDIAYAWANGGDVVELDLKTGEVGKTIGNTERSWHMKLSPDDKYIMTKVNAGFWILSIADGKAWEVKIDEREPGRSHSVHDSYRFVPANTDWIMYWYESSHPGGGLNKEGFRLRNFKTDEEKIVPFRFDWNHGDVGRYMGYHVTPYVTMWDAAKFTFERNVGLAWPEKRWTDAGPWYSNPVSVGGYAAHWPDDQLWAYSCVYIHDEPGQAYLSENSKVFAKPLEEGGRVNRFRVCYNNLWGRKDRWGNASISLMRPNMSPDGTKLLFNSNVFNPDGVYMVVCALPMAPTDVAVAARDAGVEVTWKAPKYHSEIVGYNVYRSSESGRGFRLITPTAIAGTKFIDEGAPAGNFYAVRSVEHSGLESTLSAEAAAGAVDAKPLAIFVEAEDGISAALDAPSPDAIWLNFEGMASNLHYIWQRKPDKAGSVKVGVNVPRAGTYYVMARMKGKDGAAFAIAGQEVAVPAGTEWKWAASAAPVELAAGAQTVEIACSKYGSCLDCLYLASDKDFKPEGRVIAEKPKALSLTAKADGDNVRLEWTGEKSKRWYYYNIYVSDRADFAPSQATLLASPDKETYLDWQLKPGQKTFYKVTQVSRDGLESAPSNAATVE